MFCQMQAILRLCLLGMWESLQLQRCVVLCVLDRTSQLWGKLLQGIVLNGAIFGGSIMWWSFVLQPAIAWLLQILLEPAWSSTACDMCLATLHGLYNVLWLLPAYIITFVVSTGWNQEVANLAFCVQHQQVQQQQQQPGQHRPAASAPGSLAAGSSSGSQFEGVAQEVYRVALFLVLYSEVWVISRTPFIGGLLYCLFLSWLYAYYCFDYKWSLQAVRLPARLDYFERRWAYFAGFGLPMSAATVTLPFFTGAAVVALLFPIYILIACGSDPDKHYRSVKGHVHLARMPVFRIALWPTERLVALVFRKRCLGG